MNGKNIEVEHTGRPDPWPRGLYVGAAVVAALALSGVIVAGGFVASGDLMRAVPTTSALASSSAATDTIDRQVALIEVSVDDFASDMAWSEVSMPPWFDVITAIGRFEGDLAVVGGRLRGDGEVSEAAFTRWTGSWQTPTILTRRDEVLRTAAISPEAIVAVVWDGLGREVGETSVWWSTDGEVFQRQVLGQDSPAGTILDMTYVTIHDTEAWIFGSARTSGWSDVMDQFPVAVLDLIARGDARVLQSGDHVTISLPGGQTIASYPIEELGTSVAALERGRSGVSIVWTSDLDGGSFEPSPHASGGGALVDSSGDLVGMDTATLEWLSRFVAVADARWSSERPKTKSDGVAVDRGVLFMSDAVVPRLHALSAEFDLILDFDVAAGIHEGVTADPFSTGLILPIVASKPAGVVMVGAPKRSVLARGLRIEFEAAGDIMLYLDDELVGRATEVVGRSVLAMQLVAEGEIEMLGPDGDLYATVAVDEIRFPAQVVVPAGAAGVILSGRSGGFELHWFTDVFGAPTATSYDGTTAYVALGPGLGIAGSAFRATIWIGTFDD